MVFLLSVLVLMATMAIKDALGTAMIVFEGRGEGHLAGLMDASGDVVNFIYTVVGVDALNKAGFSLEGAVIVLAVAFTSYNVTKLTTNKLTKFLAGKAEVAKS